MNVMMMMPVVLIQCVSTNLVPTAVSVKRDIAGGMSGHVLVSKMKASLSCYICTVLHSSVSVKLKWLEFYVTLRIQTSSHNYGQYSLVCNYKALVLHMKSSGKVCTQLKLVQLNYLNACSNS